MNNPKTGDLVYIIDPNNKEPFKMGIGLVIVVSRDHVDAAVVFLEDLEETPFLIGEIVSGERRVEII